MHRWWLNSSRREFGITIETTFTCLLDCRLVRYWVFFLQQRSCVKSWHSTAQLWLHVWGWGLKLTEGQKKKRPGYSWIQMWHGLCTEQPGSWLSDCMCHFFFFFLFILPCPLFSNVVWIMTMTKQPHARTVKGSALHCDIKVKGYFWCFL